MKTFLAEAFLPRGQANVLGEIAFRLWAAADATIDGERATARLLRSIVVPVDETCFHIYRALSAREVQAAGNRAGVSFLRVVEISEVRPRRPKPAPAPARAPR